MIIINKTYRVILVILCIIIFKPTASEFTITPVWQDKINDCWSACCVMILHAYGTQTTAEEVRCWALDRNNTNCNEDSVPDKTNNLSGETGSIDRILSHFGKINSTPSQGILATWKNEYDAGRPVIAHVNRSGGTHFVLIIGYYGNYIVYNDPDGGRIQIAFSDFSPKWFETGRLLNGPTTPINTPIGGNNWVHITNATTQLTPSTNSLSYRGECSTHHSFFPTTWSWKVILPDVNDYVVVASGTQSTTDAYTSTWNVNNFSLPAGHQWYYNYDGVIPGRVEILTSCLSDSAYTDAAITFTPPNLYSGNIIFAGQTVASAHADVKAHYSVTLTNDAINADGNISFKSGGKIDINDGVTIDNGSSVNLQIDPSLK